MVGHHRPTHQPPLPRWYWMVVAIVVGLTLVLLIGNAVAGNFSSGSSSSSSSASGASTSEGDEVFAERMEAYGADYFPGAEHIGIADCQAMRNAKPALRYGSDRQQAPRGQARAINNAAIDVYCPDQEGYRDTLR